MPPKLGIDAGGVVWGTEREATGTAETVPVLGLFRRERIGVVVRGSSRVFG